MEPEYCPQGKHPMVPDNVYVNPVGTRICKTCHRESALASYYRRKAKRAAEAAK